MLAYKVYVTLTLACMLINTQGNSEFLTTNMTMVDEVFIMYLFRKKQKQTQHCIVVCEAIHYTMWMEDSFP